MNGTYRDSNRLVPVALQKIRIKPPGFGAEYQAVAGSVRHARVQQLSMHTKVEESGVREPGPQFFEIPFLMQVDIGPIVEPGPSHGTVVDAESKPSDEVQWNSVCSAQPRDVSRVRRDFRFDQCDVNQVTPRLDSNCALYTIQFAEPHLMGASH